MMANIVRRLRATLIVMGITVLGTIAGVVVGLVLGATPVATELFEGGSGGWDGIGRAMGFLFLAGGCGLLGMLVGIWIGFRKVLTKVP
ncbi:MAG: hypothetical protein ACTHY7_04055 [Marinobacter sp.]|uniref:hypothetical protein n=2 Tax=Marinobacter sp. TaxID=50741 RepID=UPI003F99FD8B